MHSVLQSVSPSIAASAVTCSDPEQRTSSGIWAQSARGGVESTIAGNSIPGRDMVPSSKRPQFSTEEAVCRQESKSRAAMEGDRFGDSATVEITDPRSGSQLVDRNASGLGDPTAKALGKAKSEIVSGVTAGPDGGGMCSSEASVVDVWSSLVDVLEVST